MADPCLGHAAPPRPREHARNLAAHPCPAPRALRPLGGLRRQRPRRHPEFPRRRPPTTRLGGARRLRWPPLSLHRSRRAGSGPHARVRATRPAPGRLGRAAASVARSRRPCRSRAGGRGCKDPSRQADHPLSHRLQPAKEGMAPGALGRIASAGFRRGAPRGLHHGEGRARTIADDRTEDARTGCRDPAAHRRASAVPGGTAAGRAVRVGRHRAAAFRRRIGCTDDFLIRSITRCAVGAGRTEASFVDGWSVQLRRQHPGLSIGDTLPRPDYAAAGVRSAASGHMRAS